MDEVRIERFDGSFHQRGAFDCGNLALNQFLLQFVTQYEKRRLGRTYVASRLAQPNVVLAFYTLASGSLEYKDLPKELAKKLPQHRVPTILLARLATDLSCQRLGLGTRLLVDAAQRALHFSNNVGAFGLEVLAGRESTVAFYTKFGFLPLMDSPKHLCLPFGTIEKTVARAFPR